MSTRIIIEDPASPDQETIRKAAQVIERGGVVVFPTSCLYGLGADAFNREAVDRVFQIKKRPATKPLLILVKSREQLKGLVKAVPESAERLMDALWPGRVTLVFEAEEHLPDNLTAGTGKIGIRLPAHPVALALVRQLDIPITGTSANISAKNGCDRIDLMETEITKHVDLVLDAGRLKGGTGSTIVDVTVHPPSILRVGEVPAEKIFQILGLEP